MRATATPRPADAILPLRVRHRQEMNGQVVHDSVHRRSGWTTTYAIAVDDRTVGYGSLAMGGPWAGTRTLFEFYVLPAYRSLAFRLFETLVDASGAQVVLLQSNDRLFTAMLHTYANNITSNSIVFEDGVTTSLPPNGAAVEQVTSAEDIRAAMAARQGGGEWRLRLGDQVVATGGILFHYNTPYGDIYMEVAEPFRRRGLGAYLVQELKRVAYEFGSIPAARCGANNAPSRLTLQKAGFVPCAHILTGSLAAA